MDKNRIGGVRAGRAGNLARSPYPSKVQNVDSATVHGRRLCLPQEICPVSGNGLMLPGGTLIAGQRSAEGLVGRVVGKASEALPCRKAESTERPSRERRSKARTRGEVSRTC